MAPQCNAEDPITKAAVEDGAAEGSICASRDGTGGAEHDSQKRSNVCNRGQINHGTYIWTVDEAF
jgi:hypothetical protein